MQPRELEEEIEIIPPKVKWYQRKGCVTVLVFSVLILGALGVFGWQVYNYYHALKTGEITPQMRRMLKEITKQTGEALPVNLVEPDDDPTFGNPDAKVVVIAFEDFQCPYSGALFPDMKAVLPEYKDKILFVYRDYPTGHPYSQITAEAANCANEQGYFWQYHDLLFSNQEFVTGEQVLIDFAKQLKMNDKQFTECLQSGKYIGEVNKDFMDGSLAGVSGTPTIFINDYKISGVYPQEFWRLVFDEVIKQMEE